MEWYEVHKIFQGGQYPAKSGLKEYIQVPKGTKLDDVKEYAEAWADRTPGGHNYGYRVFWKKVSKPSQLWLKKECKDMQEMICDNKKYLQKLETMLKQ